MQNLIFEIEKSLICKKIYCQTMHLHIYIYIEKNDIF